MTPFSRSRVVWILRHLQTLEAGEKPGGYSSSYTELPMTKKGGGWAPFEGPAGLAAVVTERLERCGQDGVCVYLCYCFRRDWQTVSRMMGLDYYDMKKRMNWVIGYISGEETKPFSYRAFVAAMQLVKS